LGHDAQRPQLWIFNPRVNGSCHPSCVADHGQVKPPPSELPPGRSPKWHSRRSWDGLGYLRVRSLANPDWNRDMPRLVEWLRRETPAAGHPLRSFYDQAVAAATRYPRTLAGQLDADASWDELLTAIDAILVERQHQHLDDVRAVGFSGKDVPPPPAAD
jgi:hypothetical protein